MCHPGRDEHAAVVVGAVGGLPEVEGQGGAVGRGAFAQVVQHDPDPSAGDIPVVGLVQVVVQADDGARLAVAPVALDHLAAVGEPLAPVRLDEDAPLVAMHRGVGDVHTGDDVGLGDGCHPLTCWRRSAGRSR